jgi:hypothetical protein
MWGIGLVVDKMFEAIGVGPVLLCESEHVGNVREHIERICAQDSVLLK